MRSALVLPFLWSCVAVLPLAAQRPRTAEEALRRFDEVKAAEEGQRRRAVGDLGDFPDAAVTAVLLSELARAEDLGYRQAVVRALGERPREGSVPALQQALLAASNNRLMDSAAEGLARQGEAGVKALGEVLAAERTGSPRRTAVCAGLGRAEGDTARDLLVQAAKTAAGRDRLPPLRGLARRAGDPTVDDLRLLLAQDKDSLVAASALRQLADHDHRDAPRLGLQLLRRLGEDASAEHFTAALRCLLLDPTGGNPEAVVSAAARAEAPFGNELLPAWTAAVGNAGFTAWLVEQGAVRKAPAERVAAATALGLVPPTGSSLAAPALGKLLLAKEPEVVRAAAMSLVHAGPAAAEAPLRRLLAVGTEATLPIALHALHELHHGEPPWTNELLQQAAGKSPALRAAALQLLARHPAVTAAQAVAVAEQNLAHKAWPVRAAAIDLLVAVRAPAGIPLLVERFGSEPGRLQEDVAAALFDLTRLRFADAAAWRDWWKTAGASFAVPPVPTTKPAERTRGDRSREATTVATYWDIPVRSERVVFVVDVSGSMLQPFGTGGGTRLDEAKRQLARVLGQLPAKAKANVVAFGTGTDEFAPALQPLDDKRRQTAVQWTQALAAKGATNVHAAIQRAFADPDVDTIFLLTDGQPSTGEVVEPGALAQAIAGWNVGRCIRIHTVALGGKSEFLERLARDSGGEHTVAK